MEPTLNAYHIIMHVFISAGPLAQLKFSIHHIFYNIFNDFFDFSVLLIINVKSLKWNIEFTKAFAIWWWKNQKIVHISLHVHNVAARSMVDVTHAPLPWNKNLFEEDSNDDLIGSRLRAETLHSEQLATTSPRRQVKYVL